MEIPVITRHLRENILQWNFRPRDNMPQQFLIKP